MPRWLVWIPGVLALGLVAIPFLGTAPAPESRDKAPRVVVLSTDHATTTRVTESPSGSSAPEIVLAGETSTASPAPVRRRSSSGPRVIEQVIYVDAPAEEPAAHYEAPAQVATAASEPVVFEPTVTESTVGPPPGPPPGTVRTRSSSRSGDIARRAAIGAGIGAILGGRRGAVGGAVGGVLGGIGGHGRGGGCSQRLDRTSDRVVWPDRIEENGGM